MSSEAFKAITLDRILAGRNLWEAMKKVQANKGSPGVDGMKTEELKEYFFENPGKLTAMIRQGEYRPYLLSECTYRKTMESRDRWEYRRSSTDLSSRQWHWC